MYIFNSKIENSSKLENLLTGRKHIVDNLEKMALQTAKKGTLFQNLLIGNRGSGKTHMLKVLYNRLNEKEVVKKNLVIAYMAEDEVGIDSYLDFMVRIFAAFKRWHEDPEKLTWLEKQIDELKQTRPHDRDYRATQILRGYLDGKDLLILIENLDLVFKGLRKAGQGKLRDFVQQYTNVSFVATSQAIFNDIRKEDMPFHNFFTIEHLDKLDLEQSTKLIKKLAQLEMEETKDKSENMNGLLKFLEEDKGKASIRAIQELTKGNHRLLVLFFDFLKTDYKYDLSEPFLKTIDKLKPYYEGFLRQLPAQQQKIIHHLAMQRTPQTGKSISENCFIAHNNVSKQMSELQKLGYISSHKEGKEKYYEIDEPLIRFCFEINEDRRGIIKLFIDFLISIYSSYEITEKYLNYKYLAEYQSNEIQSKYRKESALYWHATKELLPGWGLSDEIENKLTACCNADERQEMIKTIASDASKEWVNKVSDHLTKGEIDKARLLIEKQLQLNENNVDALSFKGIICMEKREYKNAIDIFTTICKDHPNTFTALYGLGVAYTLNNDPIKGIENLKKAIEIDKNGFATWLYLGKAYFALDKYDDAIKAFQKSIECIPTLDAWNNIGIIHLINNRQTKAVEAYKNALALTESDEIHRFLLDNQLSLLLTYQYYEDAVNCLIIILQILLYLTLKNNFHNSLSQPHQKRSNTS